METGVMLMSQKILLLLVLVLPGGFVLAPVLWLCRAWVRRVRPASVTTEPVSHAAAQTSQQLQTEAPVYDLELAQPLPISSAITARSV